MAQWEDMKENGMTDEEIDEYFDSEIPNEFDPIWDEYVGMPYDTLPWFMKREEDQ